MKVIILVNLIHFILWELIHVACVTRYLAIEFKGVIDFVIVNTIRYNGLIIFIVYKTMNVCYYHCFNDRFDVVAHIAHSLDVR